ncbi:MAG: hypothetical protein ACLUNO_07660 [Oscillospiraceae bacterium]
MIKKWRASISARMILALILALAVGVGCYFGCYRLGVWTINHWLHGARCGRAAQPAARAQPAAVRGEQQRLLARHGGHRAVAAQREKRQRHRLSGRGRPV